MGSPRPPLATLPEAPYARCCMVKSRDGHSMPRASDLAGEMDVKKVIRRARGSAYEKHRVLWEPLTLRRQPRLKLGWIEESRDTLHRSPVTISTHNFLHAKPEFMH